MHRSTQYLAAGKVEIHTKKSRMEGSVIVGPWGGTKRGDFWNYWPIKNGAISHISVTYDHIIRSISFSSQDVNGNLDHSEKFGDQDGDKRDEIDIDVEVEKLNGVSGTVGTFNSTTIITSLSFYTNNNKSYGPFGSLQGSAFSFSVEDDRLFGFNGRTSDSCLNTFSVYLMVARCQVGGPWGAVVSRYSWRYHVSEDIISRITITHDDVIRTFSFGDDNLVCSGLTYGSVKGTNKDVIDVDTKAGEKFIGISGTYGSYSSSTAVTSLSFLTNKKRSFGPFGTVSGTSFSYETAKDDFITGFHGSTEGLLEAIGVYHNPRTRVVIGAWGGSSGEPWNYEAKGGISRITITHDNVIHSICFTSQDEEGNVDRSNMLGNEDGLKNDEIDIEFMIEHLDTISGTIGTYNSSSLVITSLSFSTNTNKSYGPYGVENGTAFSFPTNGIFIGFHGRSSSCLNAIGVHLKPTCIYSDGEILVQTGLCIKPLFD